MESPRHCTLRITTNIYLCWCFVNDVFRKSSNRAVVYRFEKERIVSLSVARAVPSIAFKYTLLVQTMVFVNCDGKF